MAQKKKQQSKEIPKVEQTEIEHVEVAAVEPSALATIERAEIDMQITTAKKYPRSITKFLKKASEIISLDEDTALSCIYRRPVGKDDEGPGTKMVEGRSIRFAEIVFSTYGNIRVSDIIAEMQPRYVKAIGYAIDLESNAAARREVVESTVRKNGAPYSERMRIVAAKAAASKARRDAILSVIPQGILKQLYDLARQIAFGKGDQMTMKKRRTNLLEWLNKIGIEKERAFVILEVKGIDDIGIEQLEILAGLKTAIQDGDITIDEAFPLSVEDIKDKSGNVRIAKKLAAPETDEQSAPPDEGQTQAPKADVTTQWQCEHKHLFAEPDVDKEGDSIFGICPQCHSDKIRQIK